MLNILKRLNAPRPLDHMALERQRRRLARASEPPWLNLEVARRMSERLAYVKRPPRHILDVSGWWGGSLGILRSTRPEVEFAALEADAALRERLRDDLRSGWGERLASWAKVPTRRRPQVALLSELVDPWGKPGSPGVDLVWSNMVLHGEADPMAALMRWRSVLSEEGWVAFSTLGPGTLTSLSALWRELGFGPTSAPFVDMHDLGDMMVEAGYADPVMDQETLSLSWASPALAIEELRQWGGNISPDRFKALRTPRWRGQLLEHLANRCTVGARVQLEVEVVYGHAFNAPTRLRVVPEASLSVDAFRAMVKAGRKGS